MAIQFGAAIPVLPCADVEASLAWWTAICGFTEEFRHGDPPTYAGMSREAARIHLAVVNGEVPARTVGEQTMLRVQVADLEEWFADYQSRGGKIHPNGGLARKPWGSLEFAVFDPCGICVTFFE